MAALNWPTWRGSAAAARRTHNSKAVGSIPTPATTIERKINHPSISSVPMFNPFKKKPKAEIPKPGTPFENKGNHMILPAFVFGGIQYYKFANEWNLPFERMTAVLNIQHELTLGLDVNLLDACVATAKAALDQGKLSQAFKALDILDQARQWPVDADAVYRLAAVAFFDENENPYGYDAVYAADKVKRWRTADIDGEQLRAFFLSLSPNEYMGYFEAMSNDLSTYLAAQRKQKKSWIGSLLNLWPSASPNNKWRAYMLQELETLRELTHSAPGATTTTSSIETH